MTQEYDEISTSTAPGGGGDTGPTQAAKINAARTSLLSGHSGSSRPDYAVAGTIWRDTSSTPWAIKLFDGAEDIVLFRVDPTGNVPLVGWSDLGRSVKADDYTVQASDRGALLVANKASAIAFSASASGLGSGFVFRVENIGNGDLSVAGLTLLIGQSCLLVSDGLSWRVFAFSGRNPDICDVVMKFGGGGEEILPGEYVDIGPLSFNMLLAANSLLADQAGSLVIDIRVDTYGNFPPAAGDSICASAKPTLSAAAKSQDETLTGWTKLIPAGSVARFIVESAEGVTQASLRLKCRKN